MILCISVLSVVISPFSFLILLIWFFSLCFLMSQANGLSILFIFSKKPAFSFVDFCYGLFCFFCIYLWLTFKISFLLLTLGFFISSFSSCFRCRARLFIWLVSWCKPVMLWTFPLALLSQCPLGFGLLCFHFHLFLCIFWFLFWFLLWFVGYSEAFYLASICWNF